MSGNNFIILCVALLAINTEVVKALSEDDKQKILTFLIPSIVECSKDNAIADNAIKTVLESGDFSSVNPCFLACVMKKIEMLNKSGKFSEENSLKLSKEYLSSEDQKTVPQIIQSCDGVNEKVVSDGDKGCERVTLLLDCAAPFISLLFPSK